MPQMKRFKLIEQMYNQMELDIFGKSAKEVGKHFLPIEVKALLQVEYNPTSELIENVERLMFEFVDLEYYEYAVICRDFLQKHSV